MRALGLCAGAWLACMATPTLAAPVVRWTAPEARCLMPGDLFLRVARRSGLSVSRLIDTLVRLDVGVVSSGQQLSVTVGIVTRLGQGRRAFTAPTCTALVDAVVLVVALALDPAQRALPPVSTKRAVPPDPPDRHWLLRIAAGPELGVVGQGAVTMGIAAGLGFRLVRLEAELAHTFARRHGLVEPPDGQITLRLLLRAAARVCLTPLARPRIDAGLCASADLGWLHGAAEGIRLPQTAHAVWAALLAGPSAGLRVHRGIGVRVEAYVGAALSRPLFVIGGLGTIYQPSAVAARLLASLEWRTR